MTAKPSSNRLDDRLVPRCEEIPDDPPPGDYVVVDTLHFSNTVIELLARGASHVHVTDERGEEFAYRERHSDAVIGGPAPRTTARPRGTTSSTRPVTSSGWTWPGARPA